MGDEPALRLLIDSETKLIRRMEYDLDPKAEAAKIPKPVGSVEDMKIAWDSGEIQTTPLAAETFHAAIPGGFIKAKAAVAAVAAKPEQDPMLGKAAPDFTLTVLDGAGKTKKITKADLAGKVVVLDFWATWCPPCLIELPEIAELAEGYVKQGQNGVIFIAVSQDRNPDDGSSVRKLVEDLLDSKKLGLDKPPRSSVALDPGQEVGDAFGVQALPTLFLLDGKGTVQSVRVGYSDKLKDELAADIDHLLSGKNLIETK
jgi:thiol-disulfide isomerase/thioredoxin